MIDISCKVMLNADRGGGDQGPVPIFKNNPDLYQVSPVLGRKHLHGSTERTGASAEAGTAI